MKAAAATEERLIPVRLDIEHDQWRLRDTFVWNVAGGSYLHPHLNRC